MESRCSTKRSGSRWAITRLLRLVGGNRGLWRRAAPGRRRLQARRPRRRHDVTVVEIPMGRGVPGSARRVERDIGAHQSVQGIFTPVHIDRSSRSQRHDPAPNPVRDVHRVAELDRGSRGAGCTPRAWTDPTVSEHDPCCGACIAEFGRDRTEKLSPSLKQTVQRSS